MIDPDSRVHPDAVLGDGVAVGPWTTIGPGVEIGEGTRIGAQVVIGERVRIGRGNRIHAYCSIGEAAQIKGLDDDQGARVAGADRGERGVELGEIPCMVHVERHIHRLRGSAQLVDEAHRRLVGRAPERRVM